MGEKNLQLTGRPLNYVFYFQGNVKKLLFYEKSNHTAVYFWETGFSLYIFSILSMVSLCTFHVSWFFAVHWCRMLDCTIEAANFSCTFVYSLKMNTAGDGLSVMNMVMTFYRLYCWYVHTYCRDGSCSCGSLSSLGSICTVLTNRGVALKIVSAST